MGSISWSVTLDKAKKSCFLGPFICYKENKVL
jgi:hypothetical protein